MGLKVVGFKGLGPFGKWDYFLFLSSLKVSCLLKCPCSIADQTRHHPDRTRVSHRRRSGRYTADGGCMLGGGMNWNLRWGRLCHSTRVRTTFS